MQAASDSPQEATDSEPLFEVIGGPGREVLHLCPDWPAVCREFPRGCRGGPEHPDRLERLERLELPDGRVVEADSYSIERRVR
jgi:hypothetical protein